MRVDRRQSSCHSSTGRKNCLYAFLTVVAFIKPVFSLEYISNCNICQRNYVLYYSVNQLRAHFWVQTEIRCFKKSLLMKAENYSAAYWTVFVSQGQGSRFCSNICSGQSCSLCWKCLYPSCLCWWLDTKEVWDCNDFWVLALLLSIRPFDHKGLCYIPVTEPATEALLQHRGCGWPQGHSKTEQLGTLGAFFPSSTHCVRLGGSLYLLSHQESK